MLNGKIKQKNQIGNWMINNINIFDINNINKKDVLVKQDENNNQYCFVIIDIETCNGISRKINSIIQLSFMFLGTDYIYDTYTKPDISIPWMINNKYYKSDITKNTVKNSPELKSALLSFLNIFLNLDIEPIFIAHNSSFDKDILNLCFKFYNIEFKYNKWCNTMRKDFFNIRDNNGKLIKSLKNISKKLLNDKNIIPHNSKNDVYILYKCLLKIHNCDDEISSIIFKIVINTNIGEKNKNSANNQIFINYFKDILKNIDEFCFNKNIKVNISDLVDKYYNIINEEKDLLKRKSIIKDEIKNSLKENNYIIVGNKKIMFKEITIKEKYKKLYIIDI
jgi:DNA polymerase III epsilon subunit-like protein